MSHHADLILSPALESKEEEGLKNLGLEKGESSGRVNERELGRRERVRVSESGESVV